MPWEGRPKGLIPIAAWRKKNSYGHTLSEARYAGCENCTRAIKDNFAHPEFKMYFVTPSEPITT